MTVIGVPVVNISRNVYNNPNIKVLLGTSSMFLNKIYIDNWCNGTIVDCNAKVQISTKC